MKIIDIAFLNLHSLDADKLEQSRNSSAVMMVPASSPAIPVAEAAAQADVQLIIVISDDSNQIVGIVLPEWARSQIALRRGENPATLKDALDLLIADPAEQRNNFHHEWLNTERQPIYWCDAGMHYIDGNPCKQHNSQTSASLNSNSERVA